MINEHRSLFYKVGNLPLEKKIAILENAYKVATDCYVDKLDCNVSPSRQRTELTFEKVMESFNNKCHFVVINRPAYFPHEERYGEIGFSTSSMGVDFFLFIELSVEELSKIAEYNCLDSM